MFLFFLSFPLFHCPNNKCHKPKWCVLFLTHIKLVAHMLVCAHAIARIKWRILKDVLKNFINLTGNHLCWSRFLIKLQVWHLLWRTTVNDCFCTALAPLNVTYLFYFIFSNFFLIITATTIINISNVCFWLEFKRLQRN